MDTSSNAIASPKRLGCATGLGSGRAFLVRQLHRRSRATHLVVGPGFLGALAYIVVFPSVLAYCLWSYGLAHMGPERAGQFVHLMPVFGPVLAMVILGETVSVAQATGAAIVFLGIAVVVRGARA